MAINLANKYPGRANPESVDYPFGSFKNRTTPDSKDGMILEQGWANDFLGFFQSLLFEAGVEADGSVDRVGASQYFDSLIKVISDNTIKVYSFSEASSLSDDVGPIIVTGMDGIWEWVQTAHFTGYRHPYCGMWMDGWTPTPLPFQIPATGGTWRESDQKERRVIARYRESGLVVPSASWIKGQNMIADLGGGNWKAPDLQDMFKRMTGTDVDTANARQLGIYQSDALQNITGEFWDLLAANHASTLEGRMGNASGVFSIHALTNNAVNVLSSVSNQVNSGNRDGISFDASRNARTSTETRVTNTTVAPYIHV